MDITTFAQSYGKVVKIVSDQIDFIIKKKYMGADGKFGMEDIPVFVAQAIPLFTSISDFKVIIENSKLFIDPTAKPLLQVAFETNFKLDSVPTEMLVEEIHDIVLSVIKIIVKVTEMKNQQQPAA